MHTYMCTYIIYIGTPTHTHAYYIYISVYDLFWILYIYTDLYILVCLHIHNYTYIYIYIYTQHQHAGTASSPWLLRRHQPGTRPSAWGFTILFHGISWLNNGEKMGYHLYSGWIMLGFNGMHQEWGIDCPMRMAVHRDDDQWWLSTASWGFKIATRDLNPWILMDESVCPNLGLWIYFSMCSQDAWNPFLPELDKVNVYRIYRNPLAVWWFFTIVSCIFSIISLKPTPVDLAQVLSAGPDGQTLRIFDFPISPLSIVGKEYWYILG